jgi:xylan 1,4-beta-xylosidase
VSNPKEEQASREAHVRVNVDKRFPLRRIWRYVGYDEPNYTYTAAGRELLGKLGAMSDGPYFIRCHFILCTGDGTGRPKFGSTNIYTEDAEGNPVYSFQIVDQILDTILQTGCVPFVEIGFMPQALTTAPADVPYDETRNAGWGYPPRDYSRWADLIRALARHCVARYGLREVSRWYWELWNEPDIMYWQGTTQEYCRLYDFTEWALHSVLPQACLGGPSVTGPDKPAAAEFLEAFLEHCVRGENAATGQNGTRLDLITFHTKGGGYRTDHEAPKETPTIHRLVSHVETGLETLARFPQLEGLEVNLSECDPDGWAAGGRHDNPNLNFRNTEYYASYVANTACKLIDFRADGPNRVDGMLTWAFQFEDREYFEGLRTLSTNGIDKSVLNVFRLLARLGGMRLELSCDGSRDPLESGPDAPDALPDVSAIAATDQKAGVQVFLCSHHDDWDVRVSNTIHIALEGLAPEKRYSVTLWPVDHNNANAYTAWVAMGSPQKPSDEQLNQLRIASTLKPVRGRTVESDGHGKAEVTATLMTHAVCLLEITPEIA